MNRISFILGVYKEQCKKIDCPVIVRDRYTELRARYHRRRKTDVIILSKK